MIKIPILNQEVIFSLICTFATSLVSSLDSQYSALISSPNTDLTASLSGLLLNNVYFLSAPSSLVFLGEATLHHKLGKQSQQHSTSMLRLNVQQCQCSLSHKSNNAGHLHATSVMEMRSSYRCGMCNAGVRGKVSCFLFLELWPP